MTLHATHDFAFKLVLVLGAMIAEIIAFRCNRKCMVIGKNVESDVENGVKWDGIGRD